MIGTVAAIVSRMDLSSMELILWWGPLRKKSNTNEPNPNGTPEQSKINKNKCFKNHKKCLLIKYIISTGHLVSFTIYNKPTK